ncbi:MAG: SRPBCC family protein [Xanthomonadaceae bacterium]|nr:SRPBCC family protein [Xanthomonadaceae bacterium]
MIKKILMGLGVVVIGFLGAVSMQPADYTITRSVTVNAAPQTIFPYVNDPKKMDVWHPWSEIDKTAKVSYSGAPSGLGAKTEWTDGEKMGWGSATALEVKPNALVRVKLEFVKPFHMEQISDLILEPTGSETKVTWTVSGKNNFIGRAFCIFGSMDKMVGGMFEKSLNRLKAIAETKK